MIDATEMVSVGRRQNILSDENISEIVELLNTDDKNSRLVSIKEVAENEYVLNPSRYLQQETVVKKWCAFLKTVNKEYNKRSTKLKHLF